MCTHIQAAHIIIIIDGWALHMYIGKYIIRITERVSRELYACTTGLRLYYNRSYYYHGYLLFEFSENCYQTVSSTLIIISITIQYYFDIR